MNLVPKLREVIPMKKPLLIAAALIAFDQAIKLAIFRFALHASTVLIPGVLFFQPVQNKNLNWLASMAGVQTPVWLMVVFQTAMLAAATLLFRYLVKRAGFLHPLLQSFYCFIVAGIGCSFIDVMFWGGSLDFLRLYHWFTFDTKDLYLNATYISLLLWEIRRSRESVCA